MTLRVLCIAAAVALAVTGCDSGSSSSSSDNDTTTAPQTDAGSTASDTTSGSDVLADDAGNTTGADGGSVVGNDAGTTGCVDACNQGQSGCDGNMTWTCDFDADGCLTQFQGTNCAALGQVCDPASGTCKTAGGGTPEKLLCPDLLPCAFENCDMNASQEDIQACANAALQTCAQQVESQNELTLFQTWQGCLSQNCQAAQTDEAYIDCLRTFCLPSYAACYTGGTYGAGECADIDGCVQASCPPPGSTSCVRGCMSQTTEQDVIAYFDLSLCAQGACTTSQTDQELQACMQQAVQSPVCGEQYTTCLGAEG